MGRSIFPAFLGAIIAIPVFFALISLGGVDIGLRSNTPVPETVERLAGLESRIAALENAPGTDEATAEAVASVRALAEANGAAIDDLRGAAGEERIRGSSVNELAARLQSLSDQVTGLTDRVAGLPELAGPASGSTTEPGAELVTAVSDLQDGLANLTTSLDAAFIDISALREVDVAIRNDVRTNSDNLSSTNASVAALDDRVDRVDAAVADVSVAVDAARTDLAASVNAVGIDTTARDGVEALISSVQSLEGAVIANGNAIDRQSGELQSASEQFAGQLSRVRNDVAGTNSTVEGLGDRIATLEDQIAGVSDRNRAAAAIAVVSLQSAISSGRGFTEELNALRKLSSSTGGDEAPLDILARHAEGGLKSNINLLADFRHVADGILAAANATTQGESVVDKLLASAQSVVRVRPLGPVQGDAPAAVLSRVEAGIARGELNNALVEWEKLPEGSRAVAEAFGADLRARVAADEAIRTINSTVLASLTAVAEE